MAICRQRKGEVEGSIIAFTYIITTSSTPNNCRICFCNSKGKKRKKKKDFANNQKQDKRIYFEVDHICFSIYALEMLEYARVWRHKMKQAIGKHKAQYACHAG